MRSKMIICGKNSHTNNQKKTSKKCKYPGCEEIYFGYGVSKYCEEHQKLQYRAILYKKEFIDTNQIIKTKVTSPEKTYLICQCCSIPFEITLYYNISVYPKYCECHRNEFKRNLFEKMKETSQTLI